MIIVIFFSFSSMLFGYYYCISYAHGLSSMGQAAQSADDFLGRARTIVQYYTSCIMYCSHMLSSLPNQSCNAL